MKKIITVLFFMLCATALQAKDKPNPADYTVKVHISASHLTVECGQGVCAILLYADSTLNGKKLLLSGNAVKVKKIPMLIAPGDYPAKPIKDVHDADGSLLSQNYEVLLPDDIVWDCSTVGISE
jgi:hypothetical protein